MGGRPGCRLWGTTTAPTGGTAINNEILKGLGNEIQTLTFGWIFEHVLGGSFAVPPQCFVTATQGRGLL